MESISRSARIHSPDSEELRLFERCSRLAEKFENSPLLRGLYHIYFVSCKNGNEVFGQLKTLDPQDPDEVIRILQEIDADLAKAIEYACKERIIWIREGGFWGDQNKIKELLPGVENPQQEFVAIGNWFEEWMNIISHYGLTSTIDQYPDSYQKGLLTRIESVLRRGVLGSNHDGLNS